VNQRSIAMDNGLSVGLERVPITPPIGIRLIGYFGREKGSQYLLDDLYATALVLANESTKLAIVTCDLLFVHAQDVARIRREIAARTDIPASQVMVCCSHTHSGPITFITEQQSERDRAYVETYIQHIVGAVCAANREPQPARIGYARRQAHIGINRRELTGEGQIILGENPTGPVDPEVLVARIDTLDGYPLAVLVNHACHGVVLGGGSYGISADWPGAMRRFVEESTGSTCLFVQGACADINPLKSPSRDYAQVVRLGQAAAGAAIQAWAMADGWQHEDVTLAAEQETILLPLMNGALSHEPQEVVQKKFDQSWETFVKTLDLRFPWQGQVKEGADGLGTPAEIQAFRIGDLGLVAVPVEPFVQIGLSVKRRAALPQTVFAGYSNGCVGYLPVPAAYETGGYEVNTAYLYYHLPAPLAPECAEMVEDTAVSLLNKLV
jgi:hypothetical protein